MTDKCRHEKQQTVISSHPQTNLEDSLQRLHSGDDVADDTRLIYTRDHKNTTNTVWLPHTAALLLHAFNGPLSRTTWVSRHQKGKPFWISLEKEMTEWQRHQLDHLQIICTLLKADNHASTSPLSLLEAGCPSCCPTNSVKALKTMVPHTASGSKNTTASIRATTVPGNALISTTP